MSFIADKVKMDGLTYDDVLLIPAYSEVLPSQVSLKTKFSRNISLNVPIVSAAMDTVTEQQLAIAIAREGGIGVIHKNMSIAEQARQVHAVKRAENGMIYDPVTIKRGSTVADALKMMEEYHIGGIPVVDDAKHLVGIVTNRDLRFERDLNKLIDDVMTKDNLITTNQSTDLEQAAQILQQHKIAVAELVEAKADDLVVVGGHDVVIAACGACGADAAAHEVCGHARGDGHDELAILHGDVHLLKQVRVEVHAADAVLKPFDLHALPLGAHLDAVSDGELVERLLREIAEHMLHAAMGACHEAACALCVAGDDGCRVTDAK